MKIFSIILLAQLLCFLPETAKGQSQTFLINKLRVSLNLNCKDSILDLTYTMTNISDKEMLCVDTLSISHDFNEYTLINIGYSKKMFFDKKNCIIKVLFPYEKVTKQVKYKLDSPYKPVKLVVDFLRPSSLSLYKRYMLRRYLKVDNRMEGSYRIQSKIYSRLSTDYFYIDLPIKN